MPAGPKDPRVPTSEHLEMLYEELRRLARARVARSGPDASLVPTELVHEAYLRLQNGPELRWDNPGHFFVAAGDAMRQILGDRARARGALKRGGGRPLDLDEDAAASEDRDPELLAVDELLEELQRKNERLAAVVKLRYFAGLSVEETAASLGILPRTVNRDWALARSWLKVQLSERE